MGLDPDAGFPVAARAWLTGTPASRGLVFLRSVFGSDVKIGQALGGLFQLIRSFGVDSAFDLRHNVFRGLGRRRTAQGG
jgi:hypothetical protein